jgi:hypothetical protein
MRLALTAAVLYLGWTFLGRHLADQRWTQARQRLQPAPTAEREAEFQRTYGGSDLKIVQFFARDAVILEGQRTVICYGVLNARTVRVDPPVAALSPSLSHCIEAAPQRDTRYTLTAENAAGAAVTSSLEIQVRPDPADLPRISYFRAEKPRLEDGRYIFRLSFAQENGQLVEIDPPVFPALHGAPLGQFYVAPRQTTTYVLTVTGKHSRQSKRSLTVEVPPA